MTPTQLPRPTSPDDWRTSALGEKTDQRELGPRVLILHYSFPGQAVKRGVLYIFLKNKTNLYFQCYRLNSGLCGCQATTLNHNVSLVFSSHSFINCCT